ncbi:MIP/aquaporin family protein [Anaerolineales bacterium HSG24]|nr:MIP/aquaporin family protein [Anaerolineales bacterium HSG24]
MDTFMGEMIGTMMLILLGNGVVANVVLNETKGSGGGGGGAWITITAGWGFAVLVGVFTVAHLSGAHINPAVTIGLAVAGNFPWASVVPYIIAQMIGAFIGTTLVWLAYFDHWGKTDDAGAKLACFSTGPAIRNLPMNVLTEAIGTFVLVFGVFLIKGASFDDSGSVVPVSLGALGAIPVALLVFGIGLSLGGPTGYAINPARDLAPRIAHFLLPIPGKGDSDWEYSWVPVVGPIIGAVVAAVVYMALKPFGF